MMLSPGQTTCHDCHRSITRKIVMMHEKGWTVARDRCPNCQHRYLITLRDKVANN